MLCLLRLCKAVPALQVCIGMLHLEIDSLSNSLIINGLHKVLYRRCACVSVRLTLQIREPVFRFMNLSDFFQKSSLSTPSHLNGDSPGGACGFAIAPPAPPLLRFP